MNPSLKRIQDAMLILHQEITSLTKNQERIEKILNGMSGTLSGLKQGKVPKDEEETIPKKIKKAKRKVKKVKTPAEIPTAPEKAAKTNGSGNGIKPHPKSHLTDSERAQILQLDKEGITGVKIGRMIGRSQTAVAMFLRKEREKNAGVS